MAAITQFVDFKLKSILVAADFARISKASASHAAALASIYSAELSLMHVVSPDRFDNLRPKAEVFEDAWAKMHELERAIIDGGRRSEISCRLILREGDVWTNVKDVIDRQRIGLVVIGARNRASAHTASLGVVAEQVFRHAHCNVLTFGDNAEPPERMRRLIYPTDLSVASLAALPDAIAIANHHLAQLVLVRVPGSTSANRKNFLEKMARILTTYVPAVKPEGYEVFADPVSSILRVATDGNANGIVMSSHLGDRLDDAESWWSTAYRVASRAACPFLSFRCSQRKLRFN